MDKKRVYTFGNGQAEGKADMKNLLGGKGANLAEMNLIGIPVPPGFTITTDVCTEYNTLGRDKVIVFMLLVVMVMMVVMLMLFVVVIVFKIGRASCRERV